MPVPDVAVWLDTYRHDLKRSLTAAARDGFRALQASSAVPGLTPAELSGSGRRHLRRYLEQLGLRCAGLSADFPGAGLADPQWAEQRLARLGELAELARGLGVDTVAAPLTGLAAPATAGLARELLAAAADVADRHGVRLCVQPAVHELAEAATALRGLGAPHAGLRLDTAAPLTTPQALDAAGALVRDVHLLDYRRAGSGLEEVAIGRGEVDFARLIAALGQVDAPPALVVRQNAAGLGVDALRRGREYIETLLGGAPRLRERER